MYRTFRFGITNGGMRDAQAWTTSARRAEELGYDTFLLPDTVHTPAPLPALAAAAAVTRTLRVGTWVLCDPLRDPRMLAWEASTVQQLCDGRFELGIGAGRPGAEQDAEAVGAEFGSAGQRVQRLAATLAVLRERAPGTRLMVAASGPRLLALAATAADIVAFGWPPTTGVEGARAKVDVVREAAGERFDDLELAAGLIAVGDADQPWLARMGTDARTLVESGAVTAIGGDPTAMADALQRRRDALGISYVTVPSSAIEQFAPVVELLAGR